MIIGLLGMGTVGSGVFEIAEGLEDVCVKRVLKRRGHADYMTEKIEDIVGDPEIELVAEAMGGLHPTYEYAVAALENGKHFVTANKLLVSVYGAELTALARKKGKAFLFGSACGGGIAFLANLQLARSIDRLTALGGILNGTTNFILDAMQRFHMDYASALAQAQALGYAERDPSSDVDGLDSMRKLVLACAVGFDAYVDPEAIPVFGISSVLPCDIAYAQENALALRLCVFARRDGDRLSAYVEPTLVPANSPESAIIENINYAWYEGAQCGLMSYTGQGAGKYPTASNLLRDVCSVAAGQRYMTRERCAAHTIDNQNEKHRYYVRMADGSALPEAWIARRSGDVYETTEISVAEMHAFMSNKKGFMAGIKKG